MIQEKLSELIITATGRKEKLEIPEEAIREALVNAIAHRDYRSTANIQIYIFGDRLEIVSPGGLPAGMSVKDLGKKSIPRNPLLFSILYRMNLVEHIGSGIIRINASCKELEIPIPKIEINENWFSIIFLRKSGVESGAELNYKTQILKFLNSGPLSKKEIAAKFGKDKPNRYLNELMSSLLLEGVVEYTIPEKPRSRFQKYRITRRGIQVIQ